MLALAAERGGNPDDPNKDDPLDFVLWQPSAPDEPSWESRWGPGRPGWHVECSALALREIGQTVDIHGGGRDLVFPHHECEAAQSEAVTGAPLARHWMHAGMVGLDGEKMSKSLGNLVFVEDLLKSASPPSPGWPCSRITTARTGSGTTRRSTPPRTGSTGGASRPPTVRARQSVLVAARTGPDRLDDDLDTPGAIDAIDEVAAALGAGAATSGETAGEIISAASLLGISLSD